MSEDRLRGALATKARLEAILSSAMDAIVTIDARHRIIFFNPAAEEMFGMPRADALGKPIETFIPERFRGSHRDHIVRFGETGETGRRMGALGAISGLRANGEEFPLEASISQAKVGNERLATVILRDITERKANEEARTLLAREVDHRAKNALAVVQAMVSLTRAPSVETFTTAVEGRIAAIARAHSLLAQNRWTGANLRKIINDEVDAYQRPGQSRLEGPSVTLAPNAVQPMELLIHELATNAVKHGALSVADGTVEIEWSRGDDLSLDLVWRESGGPLVTPPAQEGFGSTLISVVAARQLKGGIEIDWLPEGICARVHLPAGAMRAAQDRPAGTEPGTVHPRMHPSDAAPRKLLVVEDEMLIGMQMADFLGKEGWSVLGPAASLEEADSLIASNGDPDAAILDVNLDGTPVYPLAEALHDRGVPILFCTGYENVAESMPFSDCPRLRKPARPQDVASEVNRLLDRRSMAAS